MSANSTFSLGGYNIFRQEAVNPHPESHVLVRSSHASYYVAILCILSLVYLFHPFGRASGVDVPFYKAGKSKWIFDAENLVRDSYNKVNSPSKLPSPPRAGATYGAHWRLTPFQFYDRVYKIKATEGVQVLIPPKFLGELKGLPEDVLSATEAVREVGPKPESPLLPCCSIVLTT